MEKRKQSLTKASPLPVDYLKMVAQVFTSNFDAGLKIYENIKPHAYFEAQGEVASSEIILAVSLMNKDQISATTVYASTDFDPKASSPTVQDLLSACVDAIGSVYSTLLAADKPEIIEQLADESLSALENVPFHWTEVEADKKRIYIKLDKSNLALDEMADDWLKKYDPDLQKLEEETEKETEKLFVTGPKKNQPDSSSEE